VVRCWKEPAPLEDLGDAPAHDVVGLVAVDARVVQFDRAARHLALQRVEHPGDSAQRRRLACAIGAQQRHDLPGLHPQRNTPQHEDHVAVDDLDVVDLEHSVDSRRLETGD
jgi:hypothetical protein